MNTPSTKSHTVRLLFAGLALALLLIVPALARHGGGARQSGAKLESQPGSPPKYTNKLIDASSPYLLEHAHNPVNWYPWGPEALQKAKNENKPIFLSVGYSACHWCHVMAREDFENEEIAAILNEHFVAIKVDREQRPDIDAQYMLAVQMMTGSGGWPMSVFLTPDRNPFYGGTYFPPEEFKSLLNKVVEVYAKQPDAVRAQADKIHAAMANATRPTAGGTLPKDVLQQAVQGLRSRFDAAQGGFSQRPKFPGAPNLAFLLARFRKTGDKAMLGMVTTTLDRMAAGGIYDQLGGGFHRYSTDAIWRVPHFEKMLYDQSQLVLVYLDAYKITGKLSYKQVAEETLTFVSREMHDKDGGFTSTLDADSEGEEGKFYVWAPGQVKAVLGQDAPLFEELYGVTEAGDLEGKSVPHVAASVASVAAVHHLSTADLVQRNGAMRQKLLAARALRVRPHTDDKVLASWNGLMIAAYARAYQVMGDERYRREATEAARFLTQSMMPDGQLQHSYRRGKAEVPGLLEDYAYCAYGLLELAEATHDRQWVHKARALAAQMASQFGDAQNGGFYTTNSAAQGDLLTRLKEGEDNATPSANGVAALVLARLATSTGQASWRQQALRTVQAFQPLETRMPSAFPTLLTAYQDLGTPTALAPPPATVQLHAEPVVAPADGDVTVAIHVRIQQGWHINAHKTSATTLIPTTLSVVPSTGARLIRVEYPAGKITRFSFSSEPLAVYQGETMLKATVRLAHPFHRGNSALRFTLRYQACNERSCLAPASSDIGVDVTPLK
jgi:uncharacterized protein YyaL (SSP411 family)